MRESMPFTHFKCDETFKISLSNCWQINKNVTKMSLKKI